MLGLTTSEVATEVVATLNTIDISQHLYITTGVMKTPEEIHKEAYQLVLRAIVEEMPVADSGNFLVVNGDKQIFIYFVLQRGSYDCGEEGFARSK